MKVLVALALFGVLAAPVLSSISDDIISDGNWEQETGIQTDVGDYDSDSDLDEDDVDFDFGRGIFDDAKDKLKGATDKIKDVIKEIPVLKSCKCDEKQCGCCLVFMMEDKNVSSCVTMASITEKQGIQFTMEVGNIKKELFVAEKTHCYDFQTGIILACAKPYGTTTNQDGIRSCLQISLKIQKFKIVSADLDCFRFKGGKFTREEPKKEERPKKGALNRLISKLTKGKKDVEEEETA